MADEHDKWLDGEASERLLRGQPLEAVDAGARDRVGRLAGVLAALAAQGAPALGELPGEKAALAAFRDARAAAVPTGSTYGRADAGLVRIGAPAPPARRSRWGLPLRLGLAAALAAGTLGGVAVAAGSGVLPGPFRHGTPRPGASVSAAASPVRSGDPTSPAPSPGTSRTPDTSRIPGVNPGAPAPGNHAEAAGPTDEATTRPPSGRPSRRPGARWWAAATACRDLRDGQKPEAGDRRALDGLAGGPDRIDVYCRAVLVAAEVNGSGRTRDHRGTHREGGGGRKRDQEQGGGRPGRSHAGGAEAPRPHTHTHTHLHLHLPSSHQIPSDLRLCHFRKFVSERCDVSGRGGAVLSEPTGHRPSH
ncbi:hypothetical protein ACFWN1_10790 [Streptomyces sp. NPDC058459]|uniref:hypothetical protein n=1 Tax=Streptomyces sp. NPDC058459 TaxID=3346508 RepID=UPI0036558514